MQETELWLTKLFNDHLAGAGNWFLSLAGMPAEARPWANYITMQFLVVAKTIIDPADPVNFAGHLQANTLPNLLANPNGTVPQASKKILTQAAFCDQTVPNPWNYILDFTAGIAVASIS